MSEYRFPRTCFRILFSGLFVFAATVCSAQDASVVTAPQALSAEAASLPSGTSEPPENLDDLLDLGIEELGNVEAVPSFDVEVTSVTRSRSTVGKSPAAVFVMDREMIRRTGANSISELLRHVPGLQVARNSSSRTAVSSRGFNNVFSNKLLVMIDGRSVYTQLFGGVYWEVQDLVLQDIERTEVMIRFEINPDAIRKADMKASSKLIQIGRTVSDDTTAITSG
ncbi:MAG: TonB-dependent receptor plug domain-containing protein [Planctomycetota bacterium]|nr:TonB-dependent receptor plug domain-containing protein [Planctomycetota bacterium]MDA1251516.1 TonB-dependent receptor plug domain-containing protein [Planctomycetota bacterium]